MWLCVYMDKLKITGLKAQKNKNRVNVYINDEFAFGLERDVAGWLEVGQYITIEKIDQLKKKDVQEIAYRKAINFISYRQRTEFEVTRKLRSLDYNDNIIDLVIKRLRNAGLIDDERFALLWVENRSNTKPRGYRRLSFELKNKGISEDIIENTLGTAEEEKELAKRAALKKFRHLPEKEPEAFKKKLFSHLAYRGFTYDTINTVVRELWDEAQNTEEGSF